MWFVQVVEPGMWSCTGWECGKRCSLVCVEGGGWWREGREDEEDILLSLPPLHQELINGEEGMHHTYMI